MQILVATDTIGALSSQQAGEVLAQGWPRSDVQVLPVGVAGDGFVRAAADLLGAACVATATATGVTTEASADGTATLLVETVGGALDGLPLDAGSGPLGAALADLLSRGPVRRVLLDLAGTDVHDGGAGLLAALGATADVPLDEGVAGLTGLTRLDVAAVRQRLAATEIVGVVPADELTRPLLGLRGITSLRGRAAGLDADVLLRTDAALERLAGLLGPEHAATPGAGACGGLGLAVLALGGRLSTGPEVGLASARGAAGLRGADLVVTGCSVFDFAARGGGVVAAASTAAARVLAPCVVVAGEVLIGVREMRTMGVEAAYPVRQSTADRPAGGDVSAAELAATARRVGRSWSW